MHIQSGTSGRDTFREFFMNFFYLPIYRFAFIKKLIYGLELPTENFVYNLQNTLLYEIESLTSKVFILNFI